MNPNLVLLLIVSFQMCSGQINTRSCCTLILKKLKSNDDIKPEDNGIQQGVDDDLTPLYLAVGTFRVNGKHTRVLGVRRAKQRKREFVFRYIYNGKVGQLDNHYLVTNRDNCDTGWQEVRRGQYLTDQISTYRHYPEYQGFMFAHFDVHRIRGEMLTYVGYAQIINDIVMSVKYEYKGEIETLADKSQKVFYIDCQKSAEKLLSNAQLKLINYNGRGKELAPLIKEQSKSVVIVSGVLSNNGPYDSDVHYNGTFELVNSISIRNSLKQWSLNKLMKQVISNEVANVNNDFLLTDDISVIGTRPNNVTVNSTLTVSDAMFYNYHKSYLLQSNDALNVSVISKHFMKCNLHYNAQFSIASKSHVSARIVDMLEGIGFANESLVQQDPQNVLLSFTGEMCIDLRYDILIEHGEMYKLESTLTSSSLTTDMIILVSTIEAIQAISSDSSTTDDTSKNESIKANDGTVTCDTSTSSTSSTTVTTTTGITYTIDDSNQIKLISDKSPIYENTTFQAIAGLVTFIIVMVILIGFILRSRRTKVATVQAVPSLELKVIRNVEFNSITSNAPEDWDAKIRSSNCYE